MSSRSTNESRRSNTYLNSGNAVFESRLGASEPTRLVEEELERAFGEKIPALVKTSTQMIEIAEPVKRQFMSTFCAHEAIVWNCHCLQSTRCGILIRSLQGGTIEPSAQRTSGRRPV